MTSERLVPLSTARGFLRFFSRRQRERVPTLRQAKEWAEEQWARWRSTGVGIYFQNEGCPFCQWRESYARDVLFSQRCSEKDARRRWRHHAAIRLVQLRALAGCECDRLVTEQQARDRAARKFGSLIP